MTLDLWDEVQQSLRDHLGAARTKRTRQSSDALLAGKLYDDGGNRMSPTWARKGPKRWRYYVSQAVLQGDKSKAGSIVRISAGVVEALVTDAIAKPSSNHATSQTNIREPRNSRILRLFGSGRVVRPDDAQFSSLLTRFGAQHAGTRAIVVIDIERIADACGFAVPYYELVGERPVLDAHHTQASDEKFAGLADRNRRSIDGLPALDADHPLPKGHA